ncbi:sensor domain-containing diguanylate cyclase [Synechococcus sp. RSCCF101]|uniref:GGDEF domain-containing protein n=1 Tax=Synechococcus sp. RSCCF101 TaxID=2511069 RepID=UPI00177DB208|nr:sensor domain-containing diguanylate cyclase [Synechococcus sp. RSCCF101]
MWAALESLNDVYHHHHRGDGDIGCYTAERLSESRYSLTCTTPHPPDQDLGIVRGLCNRFGDTAENWMIQPQREAQAETSTVMVDVLRLDRLQSQPAPQDWMNNDAALLRTVLKEVCDVVGDVTDELDQKTQQIQASKDRLQQLIDNLGERHAVFSRSNEEGTLQFLSHGFEAIFGVEASQALSRRLEDIVEWTDESRLRLGQDSHALLCGDADHCHGEYAFVHPGGQTRYAEISSSRAVSENESLALEGMIHDITRRKELELELKRTATHDSLTSLLTRREFERRYAREHSRALRYGHELSLILLDLDQFRRLNDRHGHHAGDDVLRAIAAVLLAETRDSDLSGRYGGEELITALPDTAIKDANSLAERIRCRIEETKISTGGQLLTITASLGVATFANYHCTAEQLISHADQALARSKSLGRNRTTIYNQG